MFGSRRLAGFGLPIVAVALAALWPITAYGLSPILLPVLLVLGAGVALVITRVEYGLALALILSSEVGLQVPSPAGAAISVPAAPFAVMVPLLIVGVLGYAALIRGADRRQLPALAGAIAFMVAAALLSSLHALDPSRSINDTALLVTGGALFIAVTTICRDRRDLLVVVAGALIALLVASIHGIVQNYSGVFSSQGFVASGEVVGRVQGSFGHPNEYAGFLAILLPTAVAVTVTRQLPSGLRMLAGVAAAAAVPALVFSYSRQTIAVVAIGSLLWLLLLRPKAAMRAIVVLVVAVVAFAPSVVTDRFNDGGSPEDVSLRTDVAKSALEISADHPILGVGLNNFSLAYSEQAFTTPGSRRLFHNDQLLIPNAAPISYLNILTEEGLIGLAAVLVFFALALQTVYRVCRARDPAVAGLGIGIGMSVFTFSLTFSLQEPAALPFFALLAVATMAEKVFNLSPAQDAKAERPGSSEARPVRPSPAASPAIRPPVESGARLAPR